MVSKYKYKNLTWIDLESPSKGEILDVAEEFNIPAITSEEMSSDTLRSKVDFFEKIDLIYLVLHFPILKYENDDEYKIEQEIDFVIGKDFIITTHYEKIPPISKFAHSVENGEFLEEGGMGEHAGYIFLYIIKELYKHSLDKLEDMDDIFKDIENSIFKGYEEKIVSKISDANRKLLNYKQSIRHHGEILKSFEVAGKTLYGDAFTYSLGSIRSEYNKVQNSIDVHKEILTDLRETNDALLTTKTNETMKVLTIMTFIMLPMTLVTGVFGMNTALDLVFLNNKGDFFAVLGLMVIMGIVMFIYFKYKKWF